MLRINSPEIAIAQEPFPHAVLDNIFDPAAFDSLARHYPVCPPASGPTGFTIHRGDAEFDAALAVSDEWRAFFEYCNSTQFVSAVTTMFADEIDRACLVDRDDIRFADHVETRAEKEAGHIIQPALAAEAMFIRFDFMQGMDSYVRRPHLDHRRRLVTMLVYFDTPGPATFAGGDLVLHEKSGNAVSRISPKANRAVFFPCSERSWHSVDAVTQCQSPRRFLQVSVSSCHDIWPDGRDMLARTIAHGKSFVRKLLPVAV